jgi:hypothetical protein
MIMVDIDDNSCTVANCDGLRSRANYEQVIRLSSISP